MKHPLIIIAVGLLIVATWMIFQTEPKRNDGAISEEVGFSESVDDTPSFDSNSNFSRAKSKRRRKTNQTIEKIQSLGYHFSADNVRERSAAGNVTVTSPEGLTFKSEYVSISSDGDFIYLEGDILVEGDSERRSMTMKYIGEGAFAKIAVSGDSMVFEGGGMIFTQAPITAEQNKSE